MVNVIVGGGLVTFGFVMGWAVAMTTYKTILNAPTEEK